MRLAADIIENPNRRRYHIAAGLVTLSMILTTIAAGVRITLGI